MSTQVIILAGGLGKRMGGNMPKVLTPFRGRPMITYLLAAVKEAGVTNRPIIVVGRMAETVKRALGPDYEYVVQKEQLGTGHAVKVCKETMLGRSDAVVVLYGDHPFVTAEVIRRLVTTHYNAHTTLSLMTVRVPDFKDWRESFAGWGRIIRDAAGRIAGIVENKDCTPEQKAITEVNPSFFCFAASWLWENIEKLDNRNAQGEYYLTDMLSLAINQGKKVISIEVDPRLAIGVNTPDELATAETLV